VVRKVVVVGRVLVGRAVVVRKVVVVGRVVLDRKRD
jgi:hypothetical protein